MPVPTTDAEFQINKLMGQHLCNLRLKKNWSQHKLAEMTGVGMANISAYERGLTGMRLSIYGRLLGALGTDTMLLLMDRQTGEPIAEVTVG